MTNVEFHLQLNHNDTWNMSRLHFHDHFELLLPLTSPGNIFVSCVKIIADIERISVP